MEGGGPSAPAPPRAPGPRCMCGLCPGSGSSGRWGAVQLRVREPVRAPGAPSAGPACLGQHLTWRVGRAARVGVLLPAGGAAGPHPCPTWPSRPSSPGQCDPDTGLGPGQAGGSGPSPRPAPHSRLRLSPDESCRPALPLGAIHSRPRSSGATVHPPGSQLLRAPSAADTDQTSPAGDGRWTGSSGAVNGGEAERESLFEGKNMALFEVTRAPSCRQWAPGGSAGAHAGAVAPGPPSEAGLRGRPPTGRCVGWERVALSGLWPVPPCEGLGAGHPCWVSGPGQHGPSPVSSPRALTAALRAPGSPGMGSGSSARPRRFRASQFGVGWLIPPLVPNRRKWTATPWCPHSSTSWPTTPT